MKKMFGTVNEIGNFFDSAKRMHILETFIPITEAGKRPQILCPTRWASRFVSLDRLIELMIPISEALQGFQQDGDSKTTFRSSAISGRDNRLWW